MFAMVNSRFELVKRKFLLEKNNTLVISQSTSGSVFSVYQRPVWLLTSYISDTYTRKLVKLKYVKNMKVSISPCTNEAYKLNRLF